MQHKVLKVAPEDNVIVALQDLPKGYVLDYQGTEIELQTDIAAKHKFAESALAIG